MTAVSTPLPNVDLRVVYQPIVSTLDGSLAGVEALSRFGDRRPPDVWFAEAAANGVGVPLELLAVETALRGACDVPVGAYVAVNVSPVTLLSPALRPLLADAVRPVVLELTEHVAVDDYARLVRALDVLRADGVRIAVDDVGSGYAGLAHILKLRPDFVKLDRGLVTGIDHDPAKRALATAVVEFARSFGGQVVAEGVEAMSEFHELVAAGVRLAQGFVVAAPAELPVHLDLPVGLRAPRVVIVDDDPVVRSYVRMLLERGGFDVVAVADDAGPAVGYIRAEAPDIVVLDIHLPSTRGDEIVPLLRRVAPHATIVGMSASRLATADRDVLDEFFRKDDGLGDIARLLRTALAKRARSRGSERQRIDGAHGELNGQPKHP